MIREPPNSPLTFDAGYTGDIEHTRSFAYPICSYRAQIYLIVTKLRAFSGITKSAFPVSRECHRAMSVTASAIARRTRPSSSLHRT